MIHSLEGMVMNMKNKPEIIVMTDGSSYNGMLRRGSTIFKAKKHVGTQITYVEIDLDEYDERIDKLAQKLVKMPGVDLVSILKDALYDLSLDYLTSVEGKVEKELEKSKPEIKTKVDTNYRGTCVNLNVGGKNLVELRH